MDRLTAHARQVGPSEGGRDGGRHSRAPRLRDVVPLSTGGSPRPRGRKPGPRRPRACTRPHPGAQPSGDHAPPHGRLPPLGQGSDGVPRSASGVDPLLGEPPATSPVTAAAPAGRRGRPRSRRLLPGTRGPAVSTPPLAAPPCSELHCAEAPGPAAAGGHHPDPVPPPSGAARSQADTGGQLGVTEKGDRGRHSAMGCEIPKRSTWPGHTGGRLPLPVTTRPSSDAA